MKEEANLRLKIIGLLVTRYRLNKEAVPDPEMISSEYLSAKVFDAKIRQSVAIEDVQDNRNSTAKGKRTAIGKDYDALFDEITEELRKVDYEQTDDAWNTPEDKKVEEVKTPEYVAESKVDLAPPKNEGGLPASTIDRTKEVKKTAIFMSMDDYIFCTFYAKELKKQGLSGADVSNVISYMIRESKEENPALQRLLKVSTSFSIGSQNTSIRL